MTRFSIHIVSFFLNLKMLEEPEEEDYDEAEIDDFEADDLGYLDPLGLF